MASVPTTLQNGNAECSTARARQCHSFLSPPALLLCVPLNAHRDQYLIFVGAYGPQRAPPRRGSVLARVEGLISWLLSASTMLHNRVSEPYDLVA